MASFDNLDLFVDQWLLHPPTSSAADSWFSDPFPYHKADAALTNSVSSADNNNSFSNYLLDAVTTNANSASSPSAAQSITVSVSGSDPDTASNRKRTGPGPTTGGVGKRKPRASKKKGSSTTFIAADAANFRQMVQEVTGVKLPTTTGRFSYAAPVVRPEPQRIGSAVSGLVYGCLPTLDTSAFLLDRAPNGQQLAGSHRSGEGAVGEIGGGDGGGRGTGFNFDGFSCFPTLESGKVM